MRATCFGLAGGPRRAVVGREQRRALRIRELGWWRDAVGDGLVRWSQKRHSRKGAAEEQDSAAVGIVDAAESLALAWAWG